jgi:hypothetical protein
MDIRVIAVDWSGAKRAAGKRIWLAEFRDGEPVEDLVTGKDREWIKDCLVCSCREYPETVIGLDFAFSFPCWFVRQQGCLTIQDLWALADCCGEDWLSTCPRPFWGRSGRAKPALSDDEHYRKTEREVGNVAGVRPKSVFQINGAGTVGTGSIRGMRLLHRLNLAGFSVWPFQQPQWPRVVEIWPRLFTGGVMKNRTEERSKYITENCWFLPDQWQAAAEKSDDAFDAVVSACHMNQHRNQLASLEPASDPRTLLEGMIWKPRGQN